MPQNPYPDMPFKITIRIEGVNSPEIFDEVTRFVGQLYQKGTDKCLFADVTWDCVDTALYNLNMRPGIHASRLSQA